MRANHFSAFSRRIATASLAASVTACLATSVLAASPAAAFDMPEINWEGSRAQDVSMKTLDVLIVRPLATARVLVGSILFVPTAIASLPMGEEGVSGAHEVFIEIPMEYAFKREMGDL